MSDRLIMAYWRNTTGRCDECLRPVKKVYEVRDPEGTGKYPVGHFCGRFCFEKAYEDHKSGKKPTVKDLPETVFY